MSDERIRGSGAASWPPRRVRHAACTVALALALCAAAAAQEVTVLSDFESPADVQLWDVAAAHSEIVAEGVAHGEHALELTFDPKLRWRGCTLQWRNMPVDWSGYDALILDVFNPSDQPLEAWVLVGDRAWQEKGGTYWNRHNGAATFAPGAGQWVVPMKGLYRGEAGSRNNDIKRNVDPDSIVRLDLSFGREGQTGRVIVDNIRLVKASRPANVQAFDFGPPGQSAMLGWTPVSHETSYSEERGFGWWPPAGCPWDGAARDTTFGPMLLRDFCEAGGYQFRIDLPPGLYRAVVFYENSGYWGGEQAQHGERRILANGEAAWQESRPDGPAHALYRFEDVEPVGADVWDTYMAPELARPAEFRARVAQDGLLLRFEADRVWGSKVAAVALWRDEDAAASRWVDEQRAELAAEFRRSAVCLDGPPAPFDVRPEWRELGVIAWPVGMEDIVTPTSVPPAQSPPPEELSVSRLAVRDEYEPFCLAVRPLGDLGECRLELDPFAGPGGLDAVVQVVRYNTSRGFNSIAYHIMPHTLRAEQALRLDADVTREIVVTVHVAADSAPGLYGGAVRIVDAAGKLVLRAPLELRVAPVVLDRDTPFLMGFFGLMPPPLIPEDRRSRVLEETLVLLREHGMNAVSGGPSWRLTGWHDGEPTIDFGEMDGYFRLLREHGFDRPLNGYGGARFQGLHDGYEKGRSGEAVEQQSGLPYEEALVCAWRAVDEHARREGWPTIFYAMCDETRVRETAERELDFMRLMARVSAAFPQTVRTSGSYSVSFERRPTDPDDLAYWHQRFLEALDISSLNLHDESVMAEARGLGKEIQIYNQGRTRYSFGLYQWSEWTKGVRARWQWHLNILHGYQFFDLDGREPDTAMICYGRDRIYPTIHFERCREGAEDFYLYQTLETLIEAERRKGRSAEDLALATAVLAEATAEVRLNQHEPPEGYDPDRLKAEVVAAIEGLQGM